MGDALITAITTIGDENEDFGEKIIDADDSNEIVSNSDIVPTDDKLFGKFEKARTQRNVKMRALSSLGQTFARPDFNDTMREMWLHCYADGRTKSLSTSQLVSHFHTMYNKKNLADLESARIESDPPPLLFDVSTAYAHIWVKQQLKDVEAAQTVGVFNAACAKHTIT